MHEPVTSTLYRWVAFVHQALSSLHAAMSHCRAFTVCCALTDERLLIRKIMPALLKRCHTVIRECACVLVTLPLAASALAFACLWPNWAEASQTALQAHPMQKVTICRSCLGQRASLCATSLGIGQADMLPAGSSKVVMLSPHFECFHASQMSHGTVTCPFALRCFADDMQIEGYHFYAGVQLDQMCLQCEH